MATVLTQAGSGGVLAGGSATVTNRMVPVDSNVDFLWDFDGDGDVTDPIENITAYVTSATMSIGNDYSSQWRGAPTAGQITLTLNDADGRFNRWNDASPLLAGGNSLDIGRTLIVRDVFATPVERPRIAGDHFGGAAGAGLTVDAEGLHWVRGTGDTAALVGDGTVQLNAATGSTTVYIVDVGVDDYYLQMIAEAGTGGDTGNEVGIVYRYADADNYGALYITDNQCRHRSRVAGVNTDSGFSGLENIEGTVIGVDVQGTVARMFWNGVLLGSFTAAGTTQTKVGVFSLWDKQAAPTIGQFEAWAEMASSSVLSRYLWTGSVDSIQTSIAKDGSRTAIVRGTTKLGQLARDVGRSPRSPGDHGATLPGPMLSTGRIARDAAGYIMGNAGVFDPPQDAAVAGDTELGSIPKVVATPIELIRRIAANQFEHGVYDLPQGAVGYGAYLTKGGVQGLTFSDVPGSAVAFNSVEVVNRGRDMGNHIRPAKSSVAPVLTGITGTEVSTAAGGAFGVAATAPATGNVGDLFVTAMVSSQQTSAEGWITPPGWVKLHDNGIGAYGVRVYAKRLEANDFGVSHDVFFATGTPGGTSAIYNWQFEAGTWFGDVAASIVTAYHGYGDDPLGGTTGTRAQARAGDNKPQRLDLDPNVPYFLIAVRSGAVASATAGSVDETAGANANAPDYFGDYLGNYVAGAGAVTAFDVGIAQAMRVYVGDSFIPTEWSGTFDDFDYADNIVIAVRGSAPEFTDVFATDSVERRKAISVPNPGVLFGSIADRDAYAAEVLAATADDTPVLRVRWTANKSFVHRWIAVRAYLNVLQVEFDRAAGGSTGMSLATNYVVGNVTHRFSSGDKLWEVEATLIPA